MSMNVTHLLNFLKLSNKGTVVLHPVMQLEGLDRKTISMLSSNKLKKELLQFLKIYN